MTSLLWDGVYDEKRPVTPDHRQGALWSSPAVEEESGSSRKTLLSSYGPLPDLPCFDPVIINEEAVQINKARIIETLDWPLPLLPAKMVELSSDLKEPNHSRQGKKMYLAVVSLFALFCLQTHRPIAARQLCDNCWRVVKDGILVSCAYMAYKHIDYCCQQNPNYICKNGQKFYEIRQDLPLY